MYYFTVVFFFFKQKTAYEMRISDWSSDVCSSDLFDLHVDAAQLRRLQLDLDAVETLADRLLDVYGDLVGDEARRQVGPYGFRGSRQRGAALRRPGEGRSGGTEEGLADTPGRLSGRLLALGGGSRDQGAGRHDRGLGRTVLVSGGPGRGARRSG